MKESKRGYNLEFRMFVVSRVRQNDRTIRQKEFDFEILKMKGIDVHYKDSLLSYREV